MKKVRASPVQAIPDNRTIRDHDTSNSFPVNRLRLLKMV